MPLQGEKTQTQQTHTVMCFGVLFVIVKNEGKKARKSIEKEMDKPVVSYIAGRSAPPGKRMGHAGAIIQGNTGTVASKTEALNNAGVNVAKMPSEIVELLKKEI